MQNVEMQLTETKIDDATKENIYLFEVVKDMGTPINIDVASDGPEDEFEVKRFYVSKQRGIVKFELCYIDAITYVGVLH